MMNGDSRYTITLTSSKPLELPKPRVIWRYSDAQAIDAAERELRRHRNQRGEHAIFDGWRLRKSVPGSKNGVLIAEVRPGYDSRTVVGSRSADSGVPPF